MPDFVSPVLRFAPSPNGLLHLGHAYSALLNFELAKQHGGKFLLRIEDIDRDRCKPEFATAIQQDLAWLGLAWEEPVRRQSEHFATYAASLDTLARQSLVYPCFCTRGDIARAVASRADWPRDPDGSALYPGTCKRLSRRERRARIAAGAPAALRLDLEAAIAQVGARLCWHEDDGGEAPRIVEGRPAVWGDAILRRRDVPASYHIAVVVDDAVQGVSDIVRGYDLFEATGLHRLLQGLLGLPAPRYRHHRLLLDAEGRKLSKSTRATSIRSLRETGTSVAAIRQRLGFD